MDFSTGDNNQGGWVQIECWKINTVVRCLVSSSSYSPKHYSYPHVVRYLSRSAFERIPTSVFNAVILIEDAKVWKCTFQRFDWCHIFHFFSYHLKLKILIAFILCSKFLMYLVVCSMLMQLYISHQYSNVQEYVMHSCKNIIMVAECGKYGLLFQHAVEFTVQYVICSRIFQLQIFMGRSRVSANHD